MTVLDWRHIGMRIQDIRNQRKIARKALAAMISMSDSHLCNIESSKKHASLETLVDIVNALDVSLDYIVLGFRPLHSADGLLFRSDDELEQSLMLTEE